MKLPILDCLRLPEIDPGAIESGALKGTYAIVREAIDVVEQNGIVFLDEVGEMPLELQPHLLRVLQERKVRPLGAHKEIAFDVRVVAVVDRGVRVARRWEADEDAGVVVPGHPPVQLQRVVGELLGAVPEQPHPADRGQR